MKRPKATIAVPPIRDFYTTPHRLAALGERIVQGILRRQGWDTTLLQFPRQKRHALPLPPALSHLTPYLLPGEFGPTSFFSRYHRFGPSPEKSAKIILSQNPDVVFLSCFAFAYADDTLDLAAQLKAQQPSVPVYAGGAGVSVLPEYFLKDGCVDAVIPGEAETSLPMFLKEKTTANGIYTDSAPFSATSRASVATVKSNKKGLWLTTTLSRGCPLKCRFCANHLTQGRTFRTVPLKDFISVLMTYPRDLPVHINFEDDNLLMDKGYFFTALEAIRHIFPQVHFSAENGMDYRLLDIDTVDRLVAAGFRQFNLSMASLSQSILEDAQRPGEPQHLQEILQHLESKNIPSITYFICGLEQDTVETVIQNLRFLASQPTRVGISLFYAVPGLPGFENPERFMSTSSHLCAGSAAFPWSESLTTAQMITAFRIARYINLTRKKQLRSEDKALLTRIQKERKLYTYQKVGTGKQMVRPTNTNHTMEGAFLV